MEQSFDRRLQPFPYHHPIEIMLENRLLRTNRQSRRRQWFLTLILLAMIGGFNAVSAATKDSVLVTSDKIVEINKTAGTAVLRDNVKAVRKSSGSSLFTDYLLIVRDTTSDTLLKVLADGNVEIVHREAPKTDSQPTGPTEDPNPVFVWCHRAAFERAAATGELDGSVRIRADDFQLDAENVRYHYDTGFGRILPAAGKQVRLLVYKTQSPSVSLHPARTEIIGLADEIRVHKPSRKIILQGAVHVLDTADQSEFKAKRADIFLDAEDKVETVLANEDFSLTQPGRFSKADRAVFEYRLEEVTLIGNAYVKEKDQLEITSAQIRMHLKVNKGLIQGIDDVPVRMEIQIAD